MTYERVIKKAAWVESLLAIVLSVPINFLSSVSSGASFLLGASVGIIPSVIFAKIFFKTHSSSTPNQMIQAFYYGETIKLFTTATLFVLVFQWAELKPEFLFSGLLTMQVVHGFLLCKLFR